MADDERPRRRLKLLGIIVLVAVFAAGAAAGLGLSRLWTNLSARRGPPGLGLAPPSIETLDLTPEQRRKAHEIGERHRDELDAVRREVAPRVRAIHEKMRRELEVHLTAKQRAQLKALREKRRKRRPGPPPEAIQACSEKRESGTCRFNAPHGAVNGRCRHVPTPGSPLACVPDGPGGM